MKLKHLLRLINESNVNEGEKWFIDNTNLEKQSGNGYIVVNFKSNPDDKKNTEKKLPAFLKIRDIDFFGEHEFIVDLKKKYDAILQSKHIDYNTKNPIEKVSVPGKAPFHFELKNYSLEQAEGKYIMQSSRVSTYRQALNIVLSLIPEFKKEFWDTNRDNKYDNGIVKYDLDNIIYNVDEDIKKESRGIFRNIINGEAKEKITTDLKKKLQSENTNFFTYLVNKLNTDKNNWLVPKNYFFLLADHKKAQEKFVDTVSSGIKSYDEIKHMMTFQNVGNARLGPFEHVELVFTDIPKANESTSKIAEDILNLTEFDNPIKNVSNSFVSLEDEFEIVIDYKLSFSFSFVIECIIN